MTARRHRRFASKDGNHDPIVSALERVGVAVRDLSHVGEGISDLLVQHKKTRALMLIEIKNGDDKRDDLTPAQIKFRKQWPVTIVCSIDEALAAVGVEVARGSR